MSQKVWTTQWIRPQADRALRRRRSSRKNGLLPQTAIVEVLESRALLTTFTVLNLSDAGPGSFRQAVADANTLAGADTIVFQNGLSGTIALTSGQIVITDEVEITGNGAANTVIDGGNVSRILDVTNAAGDVTLNDVTLQNGQTSANNVNYTDMTNSGGAIRFFSPGLLTITGSSLTNNSTLGGGAFGGAIFSDTGSITIQRGTLSGNLTAGDGSYGGAIFCRSGDVTISESTVSGNRTEGQSSDGGAIFAANGALRINRSTLSGNITEASFSDGAAVFARNSPVTISQSTLSGNIAQGASSRGGSVYNNYGSVLLSQSTLTENSAPNASGGGIFSGNASIDVRNSIVANNTDDGTAPDIRRSGDINDTLIAQFSLIGRNNGTNLTASGAINPDASGNWIGGSVPGDAINPLLSPLSNNGGLTQTHALLPESRAFNGGSNALAIDVTNSNAILTTDQRGIGFARRFFGIVDMGAFESIVLNHPSGSTGDDTFVVRYSGLALSGTVSVTISSNGGAVRSLGIFPMNVPLTIEGALGSDSVRVTGSNDNDLFEVTAASLFVNGAGLVLNSIETRTLASGLGNETYRFDTDDSLGLYTIDDTGGGTDTLDFSTSTNSVNVRLNISTTQVVNSNLSLNLIAGARFENVIGGEGNDTLTGNALNNTLSGGGGADTLNGSSGNDTLNGGAGDDIYVFGTASVPEADVVTEGVNQGIDTLSFAPLTTAVTLNLGSIAVQPVHINRTLMLNSGGVFENATGGSGADVLTGNALSNRLTGNVGSDTLKGGAGNDTLVGGADDDTYVFGPASAAEADIAIEAANQGTDTISFASLTTDLTVNLASTAVQPVHTNRTLKLNSGGSFENLVGGSGADTLAGNSLANRLTGGSGNDTLKGAAGNDTLAGGANDDTYVFGTASATEDDIVIEAANQGTDTISFASLTTALTVNLGVTADQPVHTNRTLKLNSGGTFENLVGGSGADILLGNARDNQLTGGAGNNILVGNAGADTLISGAGRDILIGGPGLDTLNGGGNEDILIAGRTTSDTNVTNLLVMQAEWISTNAYATRITNLRAGVGSPAVSLKATINVLNDASEDDILTGGAGRDWHFRAIDDVITDLFANETIDVL